MPNKQANWRNGFISQYNGLREASRYAKYHGYGYDMSAVKDDLVVGYRQVAMYHAGSFDEERRLLGDIYSGLADHIEDDAMDAYRTAIKEEYRLFSFGDAMLIL